MNLYSAFALNRSRITVSDFADAESLETSHVTVYHGEFGENENELEIMTI